MATSQPVFNAPNVVLATIAALAALHVGREFLDPETERWIVLAGAFIPARYVGEALPGGQIASITSFATHMGLHGDYAHLAINSGWMLAFGSIVARRIGSYRFLTLSLVTGIAGAALFLVMNWGLLAPMVGASGAISGLMGAAVRFMFNARATGGRDGTSLVPPMSLLQVLQDQRARLMIGSWVGINLLFGLVFDRIFSAGGIAWEAHLGGFVAGLILFDWFDRAVPMPTGIAEDVEPPLD